MSFPLPAEEKGFRSLLCHYTMACRCYAGGACNGVLHELYIVFYIIFYQCCMFAWEGGGGGGGEMETVFVRKIVSIVKSYLNNGDSCISGEPTIIDCSLPSVDTNDSHFLKF